MDRNSLSGRKADPPQTSAPPAAEGSLPPASRAAPPSPRENADAERDPDAASPSDGNAAADTADRTCPARGNAVIHGLTADRLLPEIFGDAKLQEEQARFRAEWRPQTPTEETLVREMARHGLMLDFIEKAERAVLRSGAAGLGPLLAFAHLSGLTPRDQALTAAVSCDAIELLARYRRGHERAFYAALRQLGEVRAAFPARGPAKPATLFWSEDECASYMNDRFMKHPPPCPRCGGGLYHPLRRRARWQCVRCGRQVGPLTGTVMAATHLPLNIWFAAIELFCRRPDATAATLADALGPMRDGTCRHLARRLRAALASPRRSELIAGLDRLFSRDGAVAAPAPAVAVRPNLRNGFPASAEDALASATQVAEAETLTDERRADASPP